MFCIDATWSTGKPATYLFRIFPHHLSVMTEGLVVIPCDQFTSVIILLFLVCPRLSQLGLRLQWIEVSECNALTRSCTGMLELACRKQLVSPCLCTGGEAVAPYKRWNSNGGTLLVVHSQDSVDIHPLRISGIVTRRRCSRQSGAIIR